MIKSYPIAPVAKPRMVSSDRYKKRPATTKYWKFKDEVRALGICLPEGGFSMLFVIPMPKGWPEKKKKAMFGKPHQQTPDVDNFCKGLLDAVLDDDSGIWDIRITKRWGREGKIIINDGKV